MLRSAVFVVAIVAPVVASQGHDHPAAGKLGTVRFANSCNVSARPGFVRAVALLHSFEFSQAADGFNETLKADPRGASCLISATSSPPEPTVVCSPDADECIEDLA